MHWHIDYLREHVTPAEAWVSYATERLEHEWAGILLRMSETTPLQGFGCSDCKCYSHFFHAVVVPEVVGSGLGNSIYCYAFDKFV